MGKNDPKPGWSQYTPHKKSNPSNLPPELQDPEYVAQKELEAQVELEKRKQRIENGCNGNQEGRNINLRSREEVKAAIRSQINSNNYLFTNISEVLATLSMPLYTAAKRFHLDEDEELLYEVNRRFAEVKSQRLMEASKDSRNFTTVFKAVFADDNMKENLGIKTKPKSEQDGKIKIEMVGGLTDEDIANAKYDA